MAMGRHSRMSKKEFQPSIISRLLYSSGVFTTLDATATCSTIFCQNEMKMMDLMSPNLRAGEKGLR